MGAETGAIYTAPPASQSGLWVFTRRAAEKSRHKRRFLRVRRSPMCLRLNRSSRFLLNVSGLCLKNSLFAKTRSRDWFDNRLCDRPGSASCQTHKERLIFSSVGPSVGRRFDSSRDRQKMSEASCASEHVALKMRLCPLHVLSLPQACHNKSLLPAAFLHGPRIWPNANIPFCPL
jgi:hypothetical protein